MADADVVDIVADGDVVFVCAGHDGKPTRIRVSSAIVSNASSVLKAMLGPKFNEGTKLAASNNVDVPLPDDDASAMVIIFKAIHSRYNTLPRFLDLNGVAELAAMADKYDCAEAVAPMAYYWINEKLQSSDIEELPRLLESTYLLRQAALFERIGMKVVMESVGSISEVSGLLQDVYAALESERQRTILSLVIFMENQIASKCGLGRCSHQPECIYAEKYGTAYMRLLKNAQLWPLIDHRPPRGIAQILKAMREANLKGVKDSLSVCTWQTYGCIGNTLDSGDQIELQMRAKAEMVEKGVGRLCLECIRGDEGFVLGDQCGHVHANLAFGV